MSTIGIIAEFNPLHKGHEYLLSEAKRHGNVVCAISGNLVQRGDTAIAEKEIRAKMCLLKGADLVAEIPVLWSMSTAQNFALGGVSALVNLGCDSIMFGSEAGDTAPLLKIADILESETFSAKLGDYLKSGITFAAARQKAAEDLGADKGILDKPNNNLGIEYIIAARRLGADLNFLTVKRRGAEHDSEEIGEFVSATLLRQKLLAGDRDFCRQFISEDVLELLSPESLSDIKNIEGGLIALLRLKSADGFKNIPDLSEGVENKLYSAVRLATDLETLYNEIKVKRYPLARIRRLVLSAALGFEDGFFMKAPPYVRLLGMTEKGAEVLKSAKAHSAVPIVTRISEINALGGDALRVFKAECNATDLYSLSLKSPAPSDKEYTRKLIKI